MEVRAVAKDVRLSPRKARIVIDAIRGKDVNEALRIVRLSNKKNNYDIDVDDLYVVRATVDMGRSLRRMKPRAYGRADIIRRPMSHITIVVGDRGRE